MVDDGENYAIFSQQDSQKHSEILWLKEGDAVEKDAEEIYRNINRRGDFEKGRGELNEKAKQGRDVLEKDIDRKD